MTASDGAALTVGRLVRTLGDERAAPDLAWVAALSQVPVGAVERTIAELEPHRHDLAAIRARHLEGGRAFYAQIGAPLELYALVRLLKPVHVVEVGVSSGVSSAHFLLGINDNRRGTLHSIDLPTRQKGPRLKANESPVSLPPERASGWAVPPRLTRRWDLRIGSSDLLLPKLVGELGRIDLFLHDDLHTPAHLRFELGTIAPRLAPGSVVLADNTEWTGRSFPAFAERLGAKVVRRHDSDLVGLRVPGRRRVGPGRPTTRAAPPASRRRGPRARGF